MALSPAQVLSESIVANVMSYGAVMSPGTVDITAAVQAAVNAALAVPGGLNGPRRVTFPDGQYYISGTISFTLPSILTNGQQYESNLLIDFGSSDIFYGGTGDKWFITGRPSGSSGSGDPMPQLHLRGGRHFYLPSQPGCNSIFRCEDVTSAKFDVDVLLGNSLVAYGYWMRNVNFWSERNSWPTLRAGGFNTAIIEWDGATITGGSGSNSFARQYIGNATISSTSGFVFGIAGELYNSFFGQIAGNVNPPCQGIFRIDDGQLPGMVIANISVEITSGSTANPVYAIVFNDSFAVNTTNDFPLILNFDPQETVRFFSLAALSVTSLTSNGSGTATATTASAHGMRTGDAATISGAAQSNYNLFGAEVTVTGADTFTYAITGTPTTPATGTIVCNREQELISNKVPEYAHPVRRTMPLLNQKAYGYGTPYPGMDNAQEFQNTTDYYTWRANDNAVDDVYPHIVVHEMVGNTATANNPIAVTDYWNMQSGVNKVASIRASLGTSLDAANLDFYTKNHGLALAKVMRLTEWGGIQGLVTTNGPVGTFTLSAAASTTISNASVTGSSVILLFPTNAAAATLMGSAQAIFVSAQAAGTSFTVETANAVAASGGQTFSYLLVN